MLLGDLAYVLGDPRWAGQAFIEQNFGPHIEQKWATLAESFGGTDARMFWSYLSLFQPERAMSSAVTIPVPEAVLIAEKRTAEEFGRELAMLAAVKLYELGRLTSGRAAELAGVSRVGFLESLARYRVSPFEAEAEELEATFGPGAFAPNDEERDG